MCLGYDISLAKSSKCTYNLNPQSVCIQTATGTYVTVASRGMQALQYFSPSYCCVWFLLIIVFRQYKIQLTLILFSLYKHHLHDTLSCPQNSIQNLQMQLRYCESHVRPNHASQGMSTHDHYTGCPRRNGQNFGRVFLR